MKFNCYFIQDFISARWPRKDKSKWHGFFAIWPRRIDDTCYTMQRLERRERYEPGAQFICGWFFWEYRLPLAEAFNGPLPGQHPHPITRIAAAAILGPWGIIYEVPPPGRHHDVMRQMIEDGGFTGPIMYPQGFVTDGGKFVDRTSAKIIAAKAGQIIRNSGSACDPELYSEDLW